MVAYLMSFMGVASIVCLLIGMILLLHMIQHAFAHAGIVWGMISTFYPPGTYIYCRRNWENYGGRFITLTTLIVLALIMWGIVRLWAN